VRECRAIPVYSSLLVRFYHYKARTRLRVQRAPGIPHALYFLGGEDKCNDSGASRRETEVVYLELRFAVIASAAKQSIFLSAAAMDCFAEPVIGRAFARPGGCVPSMIGSLEVKVFYPA